MSVNAIISYDDTLNDQDALALGRVLATAGAQLSLAYVRHTTQVERSREELEEHEAEALLERGARWLGDLEVPRRVVVSAGTGEGLKWLAKQDRADLVVFGSDYRTAAGHVSPQHSCQTLLENGSTAVAIAPASYRAPQPDSVRRIGLLAGPGEQAAVLTARELAGRLDAELVAAEPGERVDLLVVASRPEAPAGRLMISSQAQNAIENATAPVLVLCRGVPLRFGQTVSA
jgi:nucleotide-binding universal stress UspA family protein